jgi:hypothetical protein
VGFRPPPFYRDILILDVAGLRQALKKSVLKVRALPARPGTHKTDHRHRWLLRPHGEWPYSRTAAE